MSTDVIIPFDATVNSDFISWLVDYVLENGDEWSIHNNVLSFKYEDDAIAFKLKFQL